MLLLSTLLLVLTTPVHSLPMSSYKLDPVAFLERSSSPQAGGSSEIAHFAQAVK